MKRGEEEGGEGDGRREKGVWREKWSRENTDFRLTGLGCQGYKVAIVCSFHRHPGKYLSSLNPQITVARVVSVRYSRSVANMGGEQGIE